MGEHLADVLYKLSTMLHWLGKYREANALVYLSRLVGHYNLDDVDKLQVFVEALESEATP